VTNDVFDSLKRRGQNKPSLNGAEKCFYLIGIALRTSSTMNVIAREGGRPSVHRAFIAARRLSNPDRMGYQVPAFAGMTISDSVNR
jgi:hypothetical protein